MHIKCPAECVSVGQGVKGKNAAAKDLSARRGFQAIFWVVSFYLKIARSSFTRRFSNFFFLLVLPTSENTRHISTWQERRFLKPL